MHEYNFAYILVAMKKIIMTFLFCLLCGMAFALEPAIAPCKPLEKKKRAA